MVAWLSQQEDKVDPPENRYKPEQSQPAGAVYVVQSTYKVRQNVTRGSNEDEDGEENSDDESSTVASKQARRAVA